MNIAKRPVLAIACAVAAWVCCFAPAFAASPLAAIGVGNSASYHLTTQTIKPPAGGGTSSTDNTIRFVRTSVTTFNVSVDGAQAGQITLNQNGSPNVPPALTKLMAPFGLIGLLTRGAPQPLAPNSSWAATIPIPLNGQTDNVASVVGVSQFSEQGATIVATGQNATTVKPLIRQKPAAIDFRATMNYNAAHMLVNASSKVSVAIQAGRFRTQNVGSSWMLSFIGS